MPWALQIHAVCSFEAGVGSTLTANGNCANVFTNQLRGLFREVNDSSTTCTHVLHAYRGLNPT